MKYIKLKEDAPWPYVTFPGDYKISKEEWVPFEEDVPGFKGIAHLVEYKEEEYIEIVNTEKRKIVDKKRIIKSVVPDLPGE